MSQTFAVAGRTSDFNIDALKTFPGLSAAAFQLPDDRKATATLQQIPLFPQVIKSIYSGFSEKIGRLEQVNNTFRLGPNQGREIYRLFRRAAEILDITDLPEIYLSGAFMVNATAFGMKRYMITLYAPLVAMLNEAELMAIIGHELGHVKCAHMANKTLAYYLGSFGADTLGAWIPGFAPLVASGLGLPLMYWSRMAELSCDRAALLVVQDPKIVACALSKLAGWSLPGLGEINLEEVENQINEVEQADEKGFDSIAKIKHAMDSLGDTHPLPLLRMQRILLWGKSDQYKEILAGKYPTIEQHGDSMATRSSCTTCGHEFTPAEAFCPVCGKAKASAASVLTCPNQGCGHALSPGQVFCPKCGQNLK